ncbi:MAG TPA: hypothetical protein VGO47_02890, partial [Chlamydiales bacterium]|nr:hypothetical protein [Chlamydiales bacterium]
LSPGSLTTICPVPSGHVAQTLGLLPPSHHAPVPRSPFLCTSRPELPNPIVPGLLRLPCVPFLPGAILAMLQDEDIVSALHNVNGTASAAELPLPFGQATYSQTQKLCGAALGVHLRHGSEARGA